MSGLYERIVAQTELLGLTGKELGEMLGLKKSPLTDWKIRNQIRLWISWLKCAKFSQHHQTTYYMEKWVHSLLISKSLLIHIKN